jgi:hypothetical protein
MSKLIALVATAVMVDGVRTVIQPGEALPALSKHDERELLDGGAAQSPAAKAAEDKETEKAVKAAEADFEAARQRALDEEEARKQAAADAAKAKATPKK